MSLHKAEDISEVFRDSQLSCIPPSQQAPLDTTGISSIRESAAPSLAPPALAFYQSSTGHIFDLNPKFPQTVIEKQNSVKKVRIGKIRPDQFSNGCKSFKKDESQMSREIVKYLRQSLVLNQKRREREALMAVQGSNNDSELADQNLNIQTHAEGGDV